MQNWKSLHSFYTPSDWNESFRGIHRDKDRKKVNSAVHVDLSPIKIKQRVIRSNNMVYM